MIKFQKVSHTFQAKNWLINSWKLFKKKPLTWVFMILIFNIFLIVGSSFLIGKFIVALLLPVLAGGIFIALDNASRGEPIGLENLFSVFKDKPILKELLTVGAIGMGVVALTMLFQTLTGTEYTVKLDSPQGQDSADVFKEVSEGGLFTTLIPWVWSWALLFGIPLIAINREAAIPALKHSLYGLMANIIPLFIFLMMIILLTIVSIIPVGLGLLVLFPILFGANYFAFKEIYMEADTEYVSELASGLTKIAEKLEEEEQKVVVYTDNKAHQEADLKEFYRQYRFINWLGMAFIAVGIVFAAYTFYSLQIGTNTTGKVLSVEKHRSSKSSGSGYSYSYTPTFSFTDKYGEKHSAPTSSSSSELNYPVGALVKISYNLDDLSTVQINSIKSILYLPMLLWMFGGAILYFTRSAKKNVDENGMSPRKSLFLKEGANSRNNSQNIAAELDNADINSLSDILEIVSQEKHESTGKDSTNQNTKKDGIVELVLPKKFTIDFYDEYMHITLSWFGKKTVLFTLAAVFQIGFSLFLFSEGSTGSGSSVLDNVLPWAVIITGAGSLYYALATWLNKTHIFVSQNAIEIKHKPMPWFGNKRLDTKNVKQLYSREVHSTSTSSNRSSSYALHVISFDEDDLTLLKLENSAQTLFLEQQIEKYLGIKDLRVRGEIG